MDRHVSMRLNCSGEAYGLTIASGKVGSHAIPKKNMLHPKNYELP